MIESERAHRAAAALRGYTPSQPFTGAAGPLAAVALLDDLLSRDRGLMCSVAAALWGMAGQAVTEDSLWWMRRRCGVTGPAALLSLLWRAEALAGEPPQLEPGQLALLIVRWATAGMVQPAADAPGRSLASQQTPSTYTAEIVWTVPPDYARNGTAQRSLSQAVRALIRTARMELVLCAPYLDTWAIAFLLDELRAAAWRGVAIIVLSRDQHDARTPNAQAVALLQRELADAPCIIRCIDLGHRRSAPLAHVKLVLADRRIAVLGSANITRGGFEQNLEVGVVLSGQVVEELARMTQEWIPKG